VVQEVLHPEERVTSVSHHAVYLPSLRFSLVAADSLGIERSASGTLKAKDVPGDLKGGSEGGLSGFPKELEEFSTILPEDSRPAILL
jgi:hypothetical protein